MDNASLRTLVMNFRSKYAYKKFLNHIQSDRDISKYIDSHMDTTIWFKFEDKEHRDMMLETLKGTVPSYILLHRNGQEQIRVI